MFKKDYKKTAPKLPYIWNAALVLALANGLSYAPNASSADSGSSLDSMWMDDTSKSTLTTVQGSQPAVTATSSVNRTISNPDNFAPMCSLASIKASQFVMKGGWPSTGPFKISSEKPFIFVDDNNNELSLDLAQDQVVRAQLKLAKSKNQSLDIEMNADFLLEALAVKASKIANFNQQFQKNKAPITESNPLHLTTGRYSIDISKDADTQALLISVNSLETKKTDIVEKTVKPAEDDHPIKKIETKVSDKTNVQPTKEDKAPVVGYKEQFVNLIKNWQQIKKVAIRKRRTDELSQVLSGKALSRQNDAIKWLVTNHKYYDMVPRGVVVEKYSELTPDKKYLVYAQVKEYSKYIDEASGQVLKESDTQYSVIYTIEKSNSRLLITDSQLLPEATNKPNH